MVTSKVACFKSDIRADLAHACRRLGSHAIGAPALRGLAQGGHGTSLAPRGCASPFGFARGRGACVARETRGTLGPLPATTRENCCQHPAAINGVRCPRLRVSAQSWHNCARTYGNEVMVVSTVAKKVHLVLTGAAPVPVLEWRTICGWKFGALKDYALRTTSPSSDWKACKRCFRSRQSDATASAPAPRMALSSASSSSSSSSSGDDSD